MIELYTDTTPNGYKISIMLEEVGLPYKSHHVDIGKGDQFAGVPEAQPQQQDPGHRRRDGPAASPTA